MPSAVLKNNQELRINYATINSAVIEVHGMEFLFSN